MSQVPRLETNWGFKTVDKRSVGHAPRMASEWTTLSQSRELGTFPLLRSARAVSQNFPMWGELYESVEVVNSQAPTSNGLSSALCPNIHFSSAGNNSGGSQQPQQDDVTIHNDYGFQTRAK